MGRSRRPHARSSTQRFLLAALLACALAVRVIVPAGFMVMPGAAGAAVLVPCSGQGAMLPAVAEPMAHMAMMHEAHHRSGHDAPTGPDHPCAFAVAGALADRVAMPVAVLAIVAAATEVLPRVLAAAPGRGLAAPPPPPTGPPSLR